MGLLDLDLTSQVMHLIRASARSSSPCMPARQQNWSLQPEFSQCPQEAHAIAAWEFDLT